MPFTVEQFFEVFRAYNQAVWPAQWGLTFAGVAAAAGVGGRSTGWSRLSLLLLGALWAWMALAYHLAHFSKINPLAPVFAALFLVAAGIFTWRAVGHAPPRLEPVPGFRGVMGGMLLVYGLVAYPLLGRLLGHEFPAAPGFGLPCPTTIFTLGLLSFVAPWPERRLLVVPVIWAAVGSFGAFALAVPQDYGLIVAFLWGLFLARAGRPVRYAVGRRRPLEEDGR
jgi:hypothetical protein